MNKINNIFVVTIFIFILLSPGYTMTSEEITITPRVKSQESDKGTQTGQNQKNNADNREKVTDDNANYNFAIKSIDGKYAYLSDFKGKVIFLNFWATWCPPCREEMPSIQSLFNKIKSDNLVFICVSNESEGTVWKFIKEKGYTFPIYTYSGYPPGVYEHDGIPTTFIISKDGKIIQKRVGGYNWSQPYFINLLNKLLQE